MIPAILATFLFCVSAIAANRAIRFIGSIEANFWRLLFATAILGGWAHGWGDGMDGNALGVFFVSGVIGLGIGDIALYLAYARIGSRLTLLIVHCLAAPLAAFCEWFYLGNALTIEEMLASAMILLGVAFALIPSENPHIQKKQMIGGILLGILAAAGQGIGAVMSRVGDEINGTNADLDAMTIAYQRILGGLFVGWMSFIWVQFQKFQKVQNDQFQKQIQFQNDQFQKDRFQKFQKVFQKGWFQKFQKTFPTLHALRWIVATGLAGPTLGVACYQWALKETKSGVVLPIVATAPLVVMPLSMWMEGDRPSLRAFLGGAIAVSGVMALGWK